MHVLVSTFLIFTLLGSIALPQETTLRSQSNLVLVPALVKDRDGGIAYGMQAKDFIVEDDGVEQPVRLDEAPEGQPISLVVAIQRGRRAAYEFPRMQGLKSMLDPLFSLGTARVAVVEFDSGGGDWAEQCSDVCTGVFARALQYPRYRARDE